MFSHKNLAGLAAGFSGASLVLAYGIEYYFQLTPCPLCLLQRYIFFAHLGIFGLGFIILKKDFFNPCLAFLAFLFGLLGLGLAGRHIWLQHLPADQVPYSCLASLEQLFHALPLTTFLYRIFQGGSECAKVDFTFLGLSIPWWSSIGYLCLTIISLILLVTKSNQR